MLMGLLPLLLPLALGYLVKVHDERWRTWLSRGVNVTIYLILTLMGLSLAGLDNLSTQFSRMGAQAAVLFGVTAALNLATLSALDYWQYRRRQQASSAVFTANGSLVASLADGARLIGVVALGLLIGLLLPVLTAYAERLAEVTLYLLLALIGVQLRNAGISPRQILLNRFGLVVALTLAASSLLAGLLTAPLLGWRWQQGLAMASGFGWYSLSAVIIGDQLGPALGGVAFFNDLARELLAMLLIPMVIRHRPAVGVGYAGATAMDVTLPIIQRAGGLEVVPLALVSGFLLSLTAPPLMLALLSLADNS